MKKKIIRSDGVEQTVNTDSDHHNWKGGIYFRKDGYKTIRTANDPMFGGDENTLEHRYMMAKKIGRKLKRTEAVHHINGNPSDNRIENLEIIGFKEHWEIHHGHKVGRHFTLKERFCHFCGKSFYPSQRCNSSTQKFCSPSCHCKWQWKNNPPRKKI